MAPIYLDCNELYRRATDPEARNALIIRALGYFFATHDVEKNRHACHTATFRLETRINPELYALLKRVLERAFARRRQLLSAG